MSRDGRWARLIPILFSLLLAAFFLLPIPRILSTGLVEDDAFYYLKVAVNVASGKGSTFDGLSATNGYHPLWLFLLLPLYRLAGSDPIVAFRLACLLGVALFLLAALSAHRLLGQAFKEPSPVAFGLITTSFLSFFSSNYVMETPLLLCVTWALLLYIARKDPLARDAPQATEWSLGVLLCLAFLSRLDMVFLGAVVVGASVLRGLREGTPVARMGGKVFRLLLPCLVLSTPYLAWNLYRFGHLTPISGLLKSSFPRPALNLYVLSGLGPHVVFALVVGVLLVLRRAFPSLRQRPTIGFEGCERVNSSLRLLAATLLIQVFYAFLFEKWGFAHWQMAPSFLLAGFGAGWILDRTSRVARRWIAADKAKLAAAGCVLLALLGVLGIGVRFRLGHFDPRSFYVAEWKAALWARKHLPSDSTLAAKMDAGLFSYFSQLRVININDGLVNDFAYQEVVKEKRLAAYLTRQGVGWLFLSVDPELIHDGRFGFQARGHLYEVYSDEIQIDTADVVYRSPIQPVGWGSGQMFLAIVPFGGKQNIPNEPGPASHKTRSRNY